MTRSTIDPCLYVFQAAESILWVCVYVDDALIGPSSGMASSMSRSRTKIKSLGKLHEILT